MNIYWYAPCKVFSSFKNMEDNPSFRLRCLIIHNLLLAHKHNSIIVRDVKDIKNPDIVVLMSFGEEELDLAKWLKKKAVGLIHDYSENIRGIPVLEETKKLCDRIVCCSTVLGELEKLNYRDKVVVVKDPVEESSIVHNYKYEPSKLKVAWMGMGGNASWVSDILKPIVEDVGMEYVEISNRPKSNILWDKDTWRSYLASCDIALCPQVHWQFPAKSNVKVTTALSLKLPVIASPVMSYTEIVKSGYNGYICYDTEQWRQSLLFLKNKNLRELQVFRSEEYLKFYSEEYIYLEWENVFKSCLGGMQT